MKLSKKNNKKLNSIKRKINHLSLISLMSISALTIGQSNTLFAKPETAVEKVDYFAENGFGNALAVVQVPAGVHVDGITYVSYQGTLEDPYVAAYNHETDEWQGPFQAGISELGKDTSSNKIDNHGKPTMLIDDLGYIHLFFGGHGGGEKDGENKLGNSHYGRNKHVVSKNPYDISSWEELDNISPFGSYNQAVKTDNGDIYLFYRHGSHRSNWVYQKSTDNGRTFEEPVSFLKSKEREDIKASDSWYAYATKGQGDDIIVSYDYHLCWNGRENNGRGHTTERHNAYYMVFDTKKGTWSNIEGDKIKLPVTKEVADEKTLVFDTKEQWTFNGGVHLDADGNPHIGTSIGTDLGVKITGGPKQSSHLRWTGEEWIGGEPVNPQARIDGKDTRGDFFIDESTGNITFAIGYKEANNDGVVSYFTSEDGGETFNKSKELLRSANTGYSMSSMIENAHPDARFMAAQRRGSQPVKVFLLGDNGPVGREITVSEEEL